MLSKRLITGREDTPRADATVETFGEGVPRSRETKSDANQLHGEHKHGTNKGKKVPIRDKKK